MPVEAPVRLPDSVTQAEPPTDETSQDTSGGTRLEFKSLGRIDLSGLIGEEEVEGRDSMRGSFQAGGRPVVESFHEPSREPDGITVFSSEMLENSTKGNLK